MIVRHHAIVEPYVWVFYLDRRISEADRDQLATVMKKLNYELCDSRAIGIASTLDAVLMGCAELRASPHAEPPPKRVYPLSVFRRGSKFRQGTESRILTAGSQRKRYALSSLNMSIQLISQDWNNVAQVDLPLVNPDQLRQFTIDISKVLPGPYQLMAIVYNNQTGERILWSNNSASAPEMLKLAEVKCAVVAAQSKGFRIRLAAAKRFVELTQDSKPAC